MAYELVIGNKNYSSWSFRPWLAMTMAGIRFTETKVQLYSGPTDSGRDPAILTHSPAGKVPILKTGGLIVWDSLAILEFLAEAHPDARLWPSERDARARARSISAEMHAGFAALRHECPMNMRRPVRALDLSDAARRDIARVVEIWTETLKASGGPFLFGAFSNADAMYAPVVNRFHVYAATDDTTARGYMDHMMGLPAWQDWEAEGRAETWVIEEEEV